MIASGEHVAQSAPRQGLRYFESLPNEIKAEVYRQVFLSTSVKIRCYAPRVCEIVAHAPHTTPPCEHSNLKVFTVSKQFYADAKNAFLKYALFDVEKIHAFCHGGSHLENCECQHIQSERVSCTQFQHAYLMDKRSKYMADISRIERICGADSLHRVFSISSQSNGDNLNICPEEFIKMSNLREMRLDVEMWCLDSLTEKDCKNIRKLLNDQNGVKVHVDLRILGMYAHGREFQCRLVDGEVITVQDSKDKRHRSPVWDQITALASTIRSGQPTVNAEPRVFSKYHINIYFTSWN